MPAAHRAERVHLLPIYDEYLIAFRDREAVPHGVAFRHALVIDGQVAGSWRPVGVGKDVAVEVYPTRRLTAAERRGVARAVGRYAAFLGAAVSFAVR